MDDPNTDQQEETFFKKGQYYSVTINPEDKYQYQGKPGRFANFRSLMYELFLTLPVQHIDYRFNIELSEPKNNKYGSGPRYHVHGWIKFKSEHSIFQFLDNTYYAWTRIGHIDIDTVKDMDVWMKYITKQSHIFKHVDPILTNIVDVKLSKDPCQA